MIQIDSRDGYLSASLSEDNSGGSDLSLSWFKVDNPVPMPFENNAYFAEKCSEINNSEDIQPLETGEGSSVELNSDSLYYLYCFMVTAEGLSEYGGYVVGPVDLD